ncbi:hypothetical protein CHS0354_015588 [Potamilus streckersoni]|uniref:Uncharacterized protein n=1 Tax=Potamilus streckersoni TaxID=2493646 RepID=A0AAE0TBU7_9BIVA|nr:hypothetical protein CHS0354_015588 [Potamilus streckersoni]
MGGLSANSKMNCKHWWHHFTVLRHFSKPQVHAPAFSSNNFAFNIDSSTTYRAPTQSTVVRATRSNMLDRIIRGSHRQSTLRFNVTGSFEPYLHRKRTPIFSVLVLGMLVIICFFEAALVLANSCSQSCGDSLAMVGVWITIATQERSGKCGRGLCKSCRIRFGVWFFLGWGVITLKENM